MRTIRYLLVSPGYIPLEDSEVELVEVPPPDSRLKDLKLKIVAQERLDCVPFSSVKLCRLKGVAIDSGAHAIGAMIRGTDFSSIHEDHTFVEHLISETFMRDVDLQDDQLLLVRTPFTTLANLGFGVRSNAFEKYEAMFIYVGSRNILQYTDLQLNDIAAMQTNEPPPFVKTFYQNLNRKPNPQFYAMGLNKLFPELDDYYLKEETTKPSSRPGSEKRCADTYEMMHLGFLGGRRWEALWEKSFKERSAHSMLFAWVNPFSLENAIGTIPQDDSSWDFSLIMKCDSSPKDLWRKYRPRSDLLISRASLPRLLIQANSTETESWPEDEVQMLLQGAAVVRFANTFLEEYSKASNFVLVAIFLKKGGDVSHYTLFQPEHRKNAPKLERYPISYYKRDFDLKQRDDRLDLVTQLYDMLYLPASDSEDTVHNIDNLKTVTMGMKEWFHPEPDPPVKCACPGSSIEHIILEEQGYEVELYDEKLPHIFIVHRASNREEALIAKKVREESNELEIFDILIAIHPKSEHIISLVDSFHTPSTSWVILPKLIPVPEALESFADELSGKVAQLCRGLIDGLAYLHEHCIAHMDIKPDNLLVDRDFCIKITDFDLAIKVKDENEEISGRCGTKYWIAPEVEKWLMYSPIKADRWSCGHVLQHLLAKLQKQDKVFTEIAVKLKAQDPNERTSLLKLRDSLSMSSGMANATPRTGMQIVERVRLSQEPMGRDPFYCTLGCEVSNFLL